MPAFLQRLSARHVIPFGLTSIKRESIKKRGDLREITGFGGLHPQFSTPSSFHVLSFQSIIGWGHRKAKEMSGLFLSRK